MILNHNNLYKGNSLKKIMSKAKILDKLRYIDARVKERTYILFLQCAQYISNRRDLSDENVSQEEIKSGLARFIKEGKDSLQQHRQQLRKLYL